MTDDDLARLEAAAQHDIIAGSAPYGPVPPEDVLALIAEVRRLRRAPADLTPEWAGLLCDACRWHAGPAIVEMLTELRRLRNLLDPGA